MTTMHRLAAAVRVSLPALLLSLLVSVLAVALLGPSWLGLGIAVAAPTVPLLHCLGRIAGSTEGWSYRVPPTPALLALDRVLAAELGDRPALSNADYDRLIGYFAAGIAAYRSPGCARVLYPGLPGTYGVRVEGMEGFARTAPLLAAWVATRGDRIPLEDGSAFDAFGHLVAGLRAGTDPASCEYWGAAADLDLRLLDAADVALVAWILRDRLRAALPEGAQAALLSWLGTIRGRAVYGGNWHLAPLIVGLSREAWGIPAEPETRANYAILKNAYYLGEGWFTDGPPTGADYYNAWQVHYMLHFVSRMDPSLDNEFLEEALRIYAQGFSHFFAPRGFPIFGRSVCYRMALPAPLIMAARLTGPGVSPGLARRALDVVWSHFIARGALSAGTVTQGYEAAQEEIVENYCGRTCCLWALRSLTAAYLQPPGTSFWIATPEPLPVELGSYDLTLAAPGLRVVGDHATGTVEIRPLRNTAALDAPLQRMTLVRRLAEILLRRPLRPDNYEAKYGRAAYRSDRPFSRG